MFHLQVHQRVNYAQVALSTHEAVEEHLAAHRDQEKMGGHEDHGQEAEADAGAVEDGGDDAYRLHGDHVVADHVAGRDGALLPPPPVSHGEDAATERQEEDGVHAREADEDGIGVCRVEAGPEQSGRRKEGTWEGRGVE